ncbi:hypothetical protein IVB33_07600 [Bradyrhizobium sp. 24]|nr:hypothetical protein [Bradyrhizobium sp. 24]
MTELDDDISEDVEDDNPTEDDDPAGNDLDDEPSPATRARPMGRRWPARSRAGHPESDIADQDGLLEQTCSQDFPIR